MLFHVTMTHSPENCPGDLPPDEMKKFFTEAEKMNDAAKQRNIDIQFMVSGVGHTMYALIEADNFISLNSFFASMPFKQDLQIEPVGHVEDIMSAFKEELVRQ
jgi:muconolactone delta-isomerase